MPNCVSLPRSTCSLLLAALAAGTLLVCAPVLLAHTTVRSGARSPTAAPYEPGTVVVGFASHASAAATRSAIVRSGIARTASASARFSTVALRSGVSVAEAIARLRRRPAIAWAVPDYIAHAESPPPDPQRGAPAVVAAGSREYAQLADLPPPFVPDDPGNDGVAGGWRELQWNFAGPFGVNAPQAWANLAADGHPGGAGVIVAVLDTGVAYADHGRFVRSPDFTGGDFVQGKDFVSSSPYPEDHNGHGTQVAGTIVEATNNGLGLTGLAYGARVMPVRVLDSEGDGGAAAIARGIDWAVDHHAQVINLSLEFTAGTVKAASIPELIAAIDYAHTHNVLVVAASGNEGVGELSYPAKAKWVVSVGASTEDGCLGYYSNFGANLTMVAPGGGSDADLPGDPNCRPNASSDVDIYQETFTSLGAPNVHRFGLPAGYFGTSMAAPHVSAAAALVIASGVLGPHPTVSQIVHRLTSTATRLGAGGGDTRHYGAGLLNAAAASAPLGATGPTGPTGTSTT